MREYAADWGALQATDPEVAAAVAGELARERSTLRLIASENFASPAVLAAVGSTLNNKYAEGYPGRRYYGGCEYVDIVEQLAIDRAKQLFGAEHANVQSHAGATANMAVFGAFLEPKDQASKVLGMVLAHGGHLTHGSPVNVSGMWFNFVGYEVDRETEQLDMDRVRDLAKTERPKIILAGYTAYPREIDFPAFREIADEVGALLWVDASHFIGLVAGGAFPSPVPYADVVTFTTHKALRGPRGAMILCKEEHAKAIDKAVFPMMQGGPIENNIAGKAVALKEAMSPDFKDYAHRTVRDARALAAGLADEGHARGLRGHRLAPGARRRAAARRRREDRRGGLRRDRHLAQQEPDPLRPKPDRRPRRGSAWGRPPVPRWAWTRPRCARSPSIMGDALRSPEDAGAKDKARGRVRELTQRFPLYP